MSEESEKYSLGAALPSLPPGCERSEGIAAVRKKESSAVESIYPNLDMLKQEVKRIERKVMGQKQDKGKGKVKDQKRSEVEQARWEDTEESLDEREIDCYRKYKMEKMERKRRKQERETERQSHERDSENKTPSRRVDWSTPSRGASDAVMYGVDDTIQKLNETACSVKHLLYGPVGERSSERQRKERDTSDSEEV